MNGLLLVPIEFTGTSEDPLSLAEALDTKIKEIYTRGRNGLIRCLSKPGRPIGMRDRIAHISCADPSADRQALADLAKNHGFKICDTVSPRHAATMASMTAPLVTS